MAGVREKVRVKGKGQGRKTVDTVHTCERVSRPSQPVIIKGGIGWRIAG